MVGRDAEADQAVGHRIAVDDVDAGLVAIGLAERLGGVEAAGPEPMTAKCRMSLAPLLQRQCLAAGSGKGRSALGLVLEQQSLPFVCSIASIGAANSASMPGSSIWQRTRLSSTSSAAFTDWPIAVIAEVELVARPGGLHLGAAGNLLFELVDVVGDAAARFFLAEAVRKIDLDGL